MIGQKIILIKNVVVVACQTRKELCSCQLPSIPNSQPSSHNYYHHQDPTLSTCVPPNLYSVHTVYSDQIVLLYNKLNSLVRNSNL